MPERVKSVFNLLKDYQQDRPVMNNHNTDTTAVLGLLMGEVSELVVSHAKYLNDQEEPLDVANEAADVLIFAVSLIASLGLDPETVVREKIGRNVLKYPASVFSNGRTYEQARDISKASWRIDGGDTTYYSA